MIFTKDLLLKGLAGLALCTGTAALGVHYMGGFSSSSSEVKVTEGNLGLPEGCTFSGAITTPCNLTADNIKNIRFEGKSENQTITGTGTLATLQISIPGDDEKDIFPNGYKFTLTPTSGTTLTINRASESGGDITITSTNPVDFKIKQNAKIFSLEKAWTAEELAKKAGLEKSDDHWTVGTKTVKVKHDSSTEPKTATSTQTGKIKAYVDTTYNQGFKFVIEDGDIALTNVTGGGTSITKLEELETYEIKKEGEEGWVLVRKTKAFDEVKKAIGLPAECTENTGVTECSLGSAEKLKAVNFDGKTGDATVNDSTYSNIKLKISKTTAENKERFPHGFKFILESDKDISAIAIKANTNTEFKINKGEGNSWSLEKAWTVGDLAAKIKLTTCQEDGGTNKCSFGDSINVYESGTKKVTGATFSEGGGGKKITYELNKEGYNQGIKFYIPHSEADISITGGTLAAGDTTVAKITKQESSGNGPSYEIKEEGGVWYLAKKS